MEHPIPLQLAIKHLQNMGEDEFLYMIHRKNPIPLIEMAKAKEYSCLTHKHKEIWHILICRDRNYNLEELLDV
jgi:hypothetical protein